LAGSGKGRLKQDRLDQRASVTALIRPGRDFDEGAIIALSLRRALEGEVALSIVEHWVEPMHPMIIAASPERE
jgi:hypothetical protein